MGFPLKLWEDNKICTLQKLTFPHLFVTYIAQLGKCCIPRGPINTDLSYDILLVVIKSSYIATLHPKFLVGSNPDIIFPPSPNRIDTSILSGYSVSHFTQIGVQHSFTGDGWTEAYSYEIWHFIRTFYR